MHQKAMDEIQREGAVYRAEVEKATLAEMEYLRVEGEQIRAEMELKRREEGKSSFVLKRREGLKNTAH